MSNAIAEKILNTLDKAKFSIWYENRFIPEYVEDSEISKEEILKDIEELFNLNDSEV